MASVWKNEEKINYVVSLDFSLETQSDLFCDGFGGSVFIFSSVIKHTGCKIHIPPRNRNESTSMA